MKATRAFYWLYTYMYFLLFVFEPLVTPGESMGTMFCCAKRGAKCSAGSRQTKVSSENNDLRH